MQSTITEQATITLNKDIANLLGDFLVAHQYEFRRQHDRAMKIEPNRLIPSVPSLESRRVLFELIALLKGERESHVP